MITIVPGHLILIILICAGKGVRVTCKYVCNGFGMRIGINISKESIKSKEKIDYNAIL